MNEWLSPGDPEPAPPGPRTTRVVAGLLALALVIVAAGLVLWRIVPDAPAVPPVPPPPTVSPDAPPNTGFTLEQAEAIGRVQAAAWLPEAWLLNATMQVDWPWQVRPDDRGLPPTGWVTLVYLAPWSQPLVGKQAASLSLVLDRLSGQIVVQSALGWQTAPATPVPAVANAPEPVLDSTAASARAEEAAGRQFRAGCPDLRHTSRVSLVTPRDGPRQWVITYDDTRQPAMAGLLIRIDATTGKIAETRITAAPCPGSAATPVASTGSGGRIPARQAVAAADNPGNADAAQRGNTRG